MLRSYCVCYCESYSLLISTIDNFRAIHEGDDYPMLMSLHLSIASRILLKYSNLFNEFVHQLAVELESTPDKVAGKCPIFTIVSTT